MRIEAYNKVAQIYKTDKPAGSACKEKAGACRDEVQISSFGRDYHIAKQAVAETPDIRQEKIAELAARVNGGNYDVNMDDFAAKLLERNKSFTL